jgi:formylglycine-generating enzyme required for sulfatase activity
MADIFISYAREDLERVRPIVKLIEGAGWSVFWDRTIPAGNTWRQYIGKALDEAKCVVVVWSKSSVESDWVIEEADDGRKRRILIPITIEDVILPLGFRSIQHEDLRDWKGDFEHPRAKSLVKSIEGIAGKPEKPPSAPTVKPESKIPLQEFESEPEDSSSIRIEEPKSAVQKHKTGSLLKLWPKVVALSVVSLVLLIGISIWIDKKGRKVEMAPSEIKDDVSVQYKDLIELPEIKKPESEALSERSISEQITDLPTTFTNSIGMEFVLIPPGNFTMGSQISPEETAEKFGGDAGWYKREHPAHPVEISQPFYLQKTEVTQGQWRSVTGENPSYFSKCGDDCPVENVSWDEIQAFLEKLNKLEGRDGADRYRLPTEAEWEYACRAGTRSRFYTGDEDADLDRAGRYEENSKGTPHPVGGKEPNAFGLYDMHGNVWEWVEDDWHDTYDKAPPDGQAWIDDPRAADRVIRGGSWVIDARYCRSAARLNIAPVNRYDDVGFRLARSVALGP